MARKNNNWMVLIIVVILWFSISKIKIEKQAISLSKPVKSAGPSSSNLMAAGWEPCFCDPDFEGEEWWCDNFCLYRDESCWDKDGEIWCCFDRGWHHCLGTDICREFESECDDLGKECNLEKTACCNEGYTIDYNKDSCCIDNKPFKWFTSENLCIDYPEIWSDGGEPDNYLIRASTCKDIEDSPYLGMEGYQENYCDGSIYYECEGQGSGQSWRGVYINKGEVPGECGVIACIGDINEDGVVDRTELGRAINAWINNQLSRENLGKSILCWVNG